MTQQTVISVKKPIYCKYCGTVELCFDPNRKNKAGTKMLPIEVASGVPHSCSQNPYNQQKNGTVIKTPAEISSTISQIEMQELNTKLTKIESQLTKLLEQYNVKMDSPTGDV